MTLIPIIVLAIVFILIAIRQVGKLRLQIWQIMLMGAAAVLLTGQISLPDAIKAINIDVMLFLFGMFIVGQALEESGYLSILAYRLFNRAAVIDHLILLILFGFGIASAFLMNDTLAIIGTPIMLILARNHDIKPKVLLLTLAFAITIGSVMSPIGNPQNLLIAVNNSIQDPFATFLKFLFIPTMLNLFATYYLLKFFFADTFWDRKQLKHTVEAPKDPQLLSIAKLSLLILFSLIAIKVVFAFLDLEVDFKLTYISISAAFPILLLSSKRVNILKRIDWATLIFFAAMFILMASVWQTGFFQNIIAQLKIDLASLPSIFGVSIIVSQFISNVPLVALYLPLLQLTGAATKEFLALAVGSTIAGNLLILGAASNIIIIQNAEKKAGETISFFEFAKIGIPLTYINFVIYFLYLTLVPM
ncbi:anion transporter [Candidatus Woesearchaeota archaeon]|nr:anion transporter [Candidatus Woesearchaeota archaeon]